MKRLNVRHILNFEVFTKMKILNWKDHVFT